MGLFLWNKKIDQRDFFCGKEGNINKENTMKRKTNPVFILQ